MICFDICNTVANVNPLVKARFGGDRYRILPIPEDFWTSAEGLSIFRDAEPLDHAAQTVNRLAAVYGGVTYVTSRPKRSELVTRSWLKCHGFPKGEVIFCSREEKIRVLQEKKPSLIAEDDPVVVKGLKSLGVPILVYQWEYNEGIRGDRIIPVRNWKNFGSLGGEIYGAV
ncbi:MAG: hypothetical protein NUV48_07240 [Peptococcaceae bacterium]|jgi:uncharacterized HAD superfamily protein|nr:hypothetical protein [Peptococcaceae bacterium]